MSGLPAGYTLRKATNQDGPDIRRLVNTTLTEYGIDTEPDDTDTNLHDIEASFADGLFEVLVNEKAEIVGSVGVMNRGNSVCELTRMFLYPSERGKGVGRILFKRAMTYAQDHGCTRVELETDTKLNEAVALYQRNGFEPVDRENAMCRCNMVMARDLQ